MSTIVTRAGKGSALTHTEVDANFTNLNTDKLQSGNTAASLTITSADINGGTVDGTSIGSSSASTGAFTTLSSTGNTTLGDASTDTVTVNGYMGVGGAASPSIGVRIQNTALTSTSQDGIQSAPVGTSAATTQVRAFSAQPSTAAAAFTCASVYGFRALNAVLGAGSTITNQYGFYVDDQTQGTNNYGIFASVSSGTNKWNIYASGTAANYFAGTLGIGTTSLLGGARAHVQQNADANYSTTFTTATTKAQLVLRDLSATGTYATPFATLAFGAGDSGAAWSTITGIRESSQHSALAFGTALASGNPVERMRITSAGNVKIGGTANRATTEGTNQLVIFNGTAPVGTLANGVSFYSAAGEARVMDAAGNSTLLSPHDQATNEWIFHSKHTPTGKVLRIDVEKMLRFINDHFGLDMIQEFTEE